MISLYNKYKIRVVYKSGYYHDFWVYNFNARHDDTGIITAAWENICDSNEPLCFNIGEVESIWQVGVRRGIFGEKK